MGEVVKLKPKFPADAAARRLKRLEAKVAELKASNKALIKVINSQHHQHIALLNEQMRRSMRMVEDSRCTCTPDRADFLRAIARD